MLIKSSFHDYYDTASAYGVDTECLYIRERKELEGKFKFEEPLATRWPDVEILKKRKKGVNYSYEVKIFVVGFCGALYPTVNILKSHKETVEEKEVNVVEKFHFYSSESLINFYEEEGFDLANGYESRYIDASPYKTKIHMVFDKSNYKKLLEEFRNHHTPVFVYGRLGKENKPTLVINERLSYYRFGHVKDSVTVFQDIFMYLSGVLGEKPKETVVISDKQKAAKKGHDSKYSFRKPPGGKRGKPPWR